MAKYTFSMESDDFHEVVAFLNAAEGDHPTRVPPAANETYADEPVEAEKPKATRRKAREPEGNAAATAAEVPSSSQETATTSTSTFAPGVSDDEHPMLKAPTLEEIKAKANEIITSDPAKGPKMIAGLKDRFGSGAFGALKAEDYARCWAMLEELA